MSPAREATQPQPPGAPAGEAERTRRPAAATVPGWMIDVAWLELKRPLHPAPHMAILAPLLPAVGRPQADRLERIHHLERFGVHPLHRRALRGSGGEASRVAGVERRAEAGDELLRRARGV